MFFIGIFGIESKEKLIKILSSLGCKECNSTVTGKLIKTFSYFHFFFIPLFKWDEKYYVICDRCNTVYEISKEKGKAIEKGEDLDITYWDLKVIKRGLYSGEIRCSRCNNVLEGEFKYCPYCGEKIE
jgi:hypothetical protein